MTELERARAHLWKSQNALVCWRALWGGQQTGHDHPLWQQGEYARETAFLAALSWVWEAQQAERKAKWLSIIKIASIWVDETGNRKIRRIFRKEFPLNGA